MIPATLLIASITIQNQTQSTPDNQTSPPLIQQEFDGLVLDLPTKLTAQPDQPTYKSWTGQITSSEGAKTGITQVISVVVTDLSKLQNKPTPQQICDLHNQANRTRKGFAAQLFNSQQTLINGKPMIVLIGSLMGSDVAKKSINMYHVSAALSTDEKAYEITWLTYRGGQDFTTAVKSVRNAQLKNGETNHIPNTLLGTSGLYSLLGTQYKFLLPHPTTVTIDPPLTSGMTGKYVGSISQDKWYGTAEIAQYPTEITDTNPIELLKKLGYTTWAELKPAPEAKLTNGIHVFENVPITESRHARIDIAVNGKTISAAIVSAPKDQELPPRTTFALLP